MMSERFVGKPVRRKEDKRLITGKSTYLDDLKLPGMLYAAILRSPYAHARIKSIDTSKAMIPGVVAVYTGKELNKLCDPLVVESQYKNSKVPDHYPLAEDEVNFVGEPVAIVVAEDRYVARDALENIHVEYEPLPYVLDPEKALESDAPRVHEQFSDNICLSWKKTYGDVEQAFREADEVVKVKLRIQRLAPAAMEPRGVAASYDPGAKLLTIWSSTQFPHKLRTWIATSLKMPENQIRVIAPEVGGGFGSKLNQYPEEVAIPLISMLLGRPVKWSEERSENLRATTHGRDVIAYVEAAVKRDGKVLGLKARLVADFGAYNYVYTQDNVMLTARMLPGCYAIRNLELDVVGVFTNKMATDAYRGAGRPEASYIIERVMDRVARKLGIDPAEIRRRNFIKVEEFPYTTATQFTYDTGNYEAALNKALEIAEYHKLREEQERLRREGRYIGIGISSYIEVCNFAYQSAQVRVEPTGKVLVFTSTSPHGQGEETSFAQLAADVLGISIDDVEVIHGDTMAIPYGWGTAGSWTLTSGGNAIVSACKKIREKMLKIAAHMLEARAEDLEMADGKIFVKDSPEKSVSFNEVVSMAYDPDNLPPELELGLAETSFYRPDLTFPFGTHVAVVEVNPDTGVVEVKKLVMVDDCGRVVNPLLVEGQIHGGAIQALGQALYEEVVYSEDGALITATLSDYLIPSAMEAPRMITDRTETPAPNPLGTKGVGEAATVGLTQAIVNAVEDALTPFGVEIEDTPLKPSYIWELIHRRKQQ